jgi:acetolactate synthase-1/2/3 large subunit
MGTMGYSLPAAVGAKLAAPEKQVVSVCGDGSFQMQSMELATICQNKLDIKVIVMSNGCLGMIREVQRNGYHGRITASDLSGNPELLKLAQAWNPAKRHLLDQEIPRRSTRCFPTRALTSWSVSWTR